MNPTQLMPWPTPMSANMDFYNPDYTTPMMSSAGFYSLEEEAYDLSLPRSSGDAFASSVDSNTTQSSPIDYDQAANQFMQHHQQPLGLIMQQQSPTFPHQQQQRQSHHVHKKQAKGSMNVPTHFPQSFATEVKDDFDMFSCGAESHNSRPIMVRRESLASMTHSILSPLSPELQISNMADMTTGQPHGMQQDRNREKNRLAASKCREKSKKFVDELRERERDLTNQRAKLTACAAALKDEVLMLKHEIFRHGNCKCDFIQNYLNNAAKQIT